MIGRLFRRRRRPSPPIEDLRTSEDWRVGDLALCVSDHWERPEPCDPHVGDVLRVSAVCTGVTPDNHLIIGLRFEGKPQTTAWSNISFCKITPTQEPADEEFRVFLKDSLRAPVRAL